MSRTASRASVKAYLEANYQVDAKQAAELVEKHVNLVREAEFMGSFAYWPADKIAALEDLKEKDDVDPEGEDGDLDDEDDE